MALLSHTEWQRYCVCNPEKWSTNDRPRLEKITNPRGDVAYQGALRTA